MLKLVDKCQKCVTKYENSWIMSKLVNKCQTLATKCNKFVNNVKTS